MKNLQAVLKSFGHSPVKTTLTFFTVGLGVGVLIFALSTSSAFSRLMQEQFEQEGIVVTVSNAEMSDDGELEEARPPQFDENVPDILSVEIEGVMAISPVNNVPWNEVVVGENVYRIRTVVAVDEQYMDVMGLEIVAGSAFTADDVEIGAKEAMISEGLAVILFGSPEAALGGVLQPPASTENAGEGEGPGRGRRMVMPAYTVSTVFADPGEIQRRSYAVGDMVVPYTSAIPQGIPATMAARMFSRTFQMSVSGVEIDSVESQVRDVLTREYGDDVLVEVWEGTPGGDEATLEEARSTVATFSLVVNLLGFVLLITGSIGILSIMLVEVLGRSREIALERALGASRSAITGEYFVRSLLMAGASALVGVILALVFAGPLRDLVLPIFNGVSASDLSGGIITPTAVGMGVASALLVGGVLGVFPVFSALKSNIAEGMREASA